MIPIVTPTEMAAIDAAAPEPVDVLIRRAAWALAGEARRLMGRTYGTRVVVIAGPGNNGADGRVAGQLLARRGARVRTVPVGEWAEATSAERMQILRGGPDLIVDAAFGTGLSRPWDPGPAPMDVPVLAVDIPSGVDGNTGELLGQPWNATATVTFGALKPGQLVGPGADLCGPISLHRIGLDTTSAEAHLLVEEDAHEMWPRRAPDTHKWRAATWIIGGSPGMRGAPGLAATAAARCGAGYVRGSSPGCIPDAVAAPWPVEVVEHPIAATDWAGAVLADAGRFDSIAVGPGLGRSAESMVAVRMLAEQLGCSLVLDADALYAFAGAPERLAQRVGSERQATVITPHEGEFAALFGRPVSADRLADVRACAALTDAIVLLKGPTTVIGSPDGRVRLVRGQEPRLAVAGSGDVLTGVLAAALACGSDPFDAVSAAAYLHATCLREVVGPVGASQLPALIARSIGTALD